MRTYTHIAPKHDVLLTAKLCRRQIKISTFSYSSPNLYVTQSVSNLSNKKPLKNAYENNFYGISKRTNGSFQSATILHPPWKHYRTRSIDFRLSVPGTLPPQHMLSNNTKIYKSSFSLTCPAWRTSKNMVKTLIKSTARVIFAAALRSLTRLATTDVYARRQKPAY